MRRRMVDTVTDEPRSVAEFPDVPDLTEESVRKTLQEAADEFRAGRHKPKPADPRVGTCVLCGGETVAKVTREYLGDPMHMIIGPGSANQMSTVHHGFHCVDCGHRYEFPVDAARRRL